MIVDVDTTTKIKHFEDFSTGDTFIDESNEVYIKSVWNNADVATHLETGEIILSSEFDGEVLIPIILKVVNA